MNRRDNRNPALVELILVLLFFSLSAVVLVQVFVKAHLLSEESRAQTLGLLKAQDVIEQWKEELESAEDIFSAKDGWEKTTAEEGAGTFRMICGKELTPVNEEEGLYEIRVDLWTDTAEAGKLCYIQVQVNRLQDAKTEVVLTTARYLPET